RRSANRPRDAVTYHPFCQSLNVLGLEAEPRALLEGALGLDLRALPEANVCCGFGGSMSFEHPVVAREIVARKLANVAATGARTERMMDQRPWWERLLDRDSPAGPIIVLVLLILAIGFVLVVGPVLDRLIEGEKPASHLPQPAPTLAVTHTSAADHRRA